MELLRYLHDGFLTQAQLLAASSIDGIELADLQARGLVPRASYTLTVDIVCQSCFGPHHETANLAYYAKTYPAWITEVCSLTPTEALQHFSQRYIDRLAQLHADGFVSTHAQFNTGLDAHLRAEWDHFLNGTYGLCTRSGLPEDIAAKELAVVIIKNLTEGRDDKTLTHADRALLIAAVDLLDAASTPFAPHELARSSRQRLIHQVRQDYGLARAEH